MAKRLVTISDLHISTSPLDDFDGEIESLFGKFIAELGAGLESVELVINGDFLDFVQAPPYEGDDLEAVSRDEGLFLCFTEKQSLAKLDAIYRAHTQVFNTLRNFLSANSENKITLLPGNHDADLFWSGVQASLQKKVAGSEPSRFRIHLERVYRPAAFPGLWIEHGHQFDPINSFFLGSSECWSANQPPIFPDRKGHPRLLECLGTRFMIRFLNRLDRDYPYVDNVKPFSLFVRLFAASALVGGHASIQVAITMWRLLSYLARTGTTSPRDLLSVEGEPLDLSNALADRLRALNDRTKELQSRVHNAGFRSDLPLSLVLDNPVQTEELMTFLADHIELLEGVEPNELGYLSMSGDEGTLSLARGFRIDESRELLMGAQKILAENDAKLVLMGHTHEPMDRPKRIPYLNTGSWTRYYRGTDSNELPSWSMLKADQEFPYSLRYAEINSEALEQAQLKNYAVK